MAKINQSSMKQWQDGQTMHGPDYNQERDLIIAATNDTQDQVDVLKGVGGVGTNQIQDNAVTTPKINNGAVTLGKLAPLSVDNTKLVDLAVTGNKIQDSTITSAKLSNETVTTAKIADNAVTTDKIAAGAVTLMKMGDNSVRTSSIINGAVTTPKIADGAVDAVKILDNAVITDKVADGAITPAKLSQEYYTAAQTDEQINTAISGGLPQDVVDQIIASIGDVNSDTVNVLANDAYSPSTPPSLIDTGVHVMRITEAARQSWNDSTYFGSPDVVPVLLRTSKVVGSAVQEIFYRGPGWSAVYKRVSMEDNGTWTGWKDEETTFGAQAKADAAKMSAIAHAEEVVLPQANANAQNYVDAKTWQKYKLTQDNGSAIFKGTTDANSLTLAGRYSIFGNSTNIPSANDYFIDVTTYTEGGKLIIKQEARPFGGNGYCQRHYYSDAGEWSPWSPDVFQSGVDAKQGIVNAINAKGGSASTSDTWAQLAAKINAIQQGAYSALVPNINTGNINLSANQTGWVYDFASVPANVKTISLIPTNNNAACWSVRITGSPMMLAFALKDANGLVWQMSPNAYGGNPSSYTINMYSLQVDTVAGIASCLYMESGSMWTLGDISPSSNVGSIRLNMSGAKPAVFDSTRPMTLGILITSTSSNGAASYATVAYNMRLQTT